MHGVRGRRGLHGLHGARCSCTAPAPYVPFGTERLNAQITHWLCRFELAPLNAPQDAKT